MKNILKYAFASAAVIGGFVACDDLTAPEALDLQPANKYSEEYYAALRSYKESDHSICYLWFADYSGAAYSPAFRFAGIPDSVDVVSLWGGIPTADSEIGALHLKEMREVQQKKGTKFVCVKIIRLAPTNSAYYTYSWAKEAAIPSYMEAYNTAYEAEYATAKGEGLDEEAAVSRAETAGINAGMPALRADMQANPSRTLVSGSEEDGTAKYEYPEWCVKAADYLLAEVFDNELDGYDLDYEPEGDVLSGSCMTTFIQYLGQYIGPKSENPNTLLVVDGNYPDASVAELVSYHVAQSYGSSPSESQFNRDGWKNSQLIITENIGDYWSNGGKMEAQAAFQPSKGGRKGGFGAFHGQRDYNTTESGADKATPYGHLRRAIQLQNPAVNK